MSSYSMNAHNTQSHTPQDPRTKDRIIQWIQHLEYLRTSMTPQSEDTSVPSAVTALATTNTPSRVSFLLRLPVDEGGEEVLPIARSRITHPTQLSGTPGPASEGGHPPAPVMLTIPLPQINAEIEETRLRSTTASVTNSIEDHPVGHSFGCPPSGTPHYQSGTSGAHQRLPSSVPAAAVPTTANRPELTRRHQLLRESQWYLNAALRYHESTRAVVNPLLSDMPPYPGHRWGAQDEDEICVGELNIHFPHSMIPATYPPMTRMRLARPFGGNLIVTPTVGNQFVSVGDVQKAVVAWMRWEKPHVQDEGFQLTRRAMAQAQDGRTMSVEVWAWRGLTKSIGENNVWEIHL